MIRTALILLRKDLRLLARDRTALFFLLVLPIGLGSVMGTALSGNMGGGGGGGGRRISVALEDRDGSPESEALVAALQDLDSLRVEVVADARRLVADGERAGGLVIPAGYGEGLSTGAGLPDVMLYRDPARQIASQVLLFQVAPVLMERTAAALGPGVMERYVDLFDVPEASRRELSAELAASYERAEAILGSSPAAGEEAIAAVGGGDALREEAPQGDAVPGGIDLLSTVAGVVGLAVEDLAPPRADGIPRSAGASHAFSAMAVMMLLFNLVAFAGTLLEERAGGTLDRLRLTPSAGRAVLLGKVAMTMLLASVQLLVLFAFGAVAFDVPVLEHLPALVAACAVWAFSASALGLLFATACRTRKQMEGLSTLVILLMSAVGGAWFPREITPEWFQAVGLATPVAWAMDAFHGILWYGKGVLATPELGGVAVPLLVLLGAGVAMYSASLLLYQRRFEGS